MQVFCRFFFTQSKSIDELFKKQTNSVQNKRPKENASQRIIVQRHEN